MGEKLIFICGLHSAGRWVVTSVGSAFQCGLAPDGVTRKEMAVLSRKRSYLCRVICLVIIEKRSGHKLLRDHLWKEFLQRHRGHSLPCGEEAAWT